MRILACFCLAACSTLPPADDLLAPPAVSEGVQYKMVATLSPGQEIEKCKFFTVGPEGIGITRERTRYTSGSHHVLLFTTSYSSAPAADAQGLLTDKNGEKHPVDATGVFDCAEGAFASWNAISVIAGAQSANAPDLVDLPAGVGVKVAPGTVLIMNTHYINASPQPLTTDARINLYTVPIAQIQQEAGVLFFYNPFIKVAPMSTASARMSCPITKDVTLLNAQSHMHRRGVNYVANWNDGTGQKMEELYTNTEWEGVPVKSWKGGKLLTKGTAIDYRCDYMNPENRTVLQGPTTKDEMCMFVGIYYPRDLGLEYCSLDSSSPQTALATADLAATYIGSGTKTCLETIQCMAKAEPLEKDKGMDYFGCVVNSCPGAAKEVSNLVHCQFTFGGGKCVEQCKKGRNECNDCLYQNCMPEINSCAAAKCT